MSKIKSAYEGIMFQASSSLGRDLTALFNKVFIYRDSIDYTDIPDNKKAQYRQHKVFGYVRDNTFPELIKIVKANTNLTLKRVVGVKQFQGLFAIDLSMDSLYDAASVIQHQTGTITFEQHDIITKTAKEMQNMSSIFDASTGRLTASKYKATDKKDRPVFGTLYFDIPFAFLMYDNFPKGAAEELTASELAAIVMHEIGHVLTMVERAGDNYLVIERMNDTCKRLASYSNKEVTPDMAKEAVKAINNHILPAISDPNGIFTKLFGSTDKIQSIFTKISNAMNNVSNIDASDYDSVTSRTSTVIIGILFRMFVTFSLSMLKIGSLMIIYALNSPGNELANSILKGMRVILNKITSPEKNVKVGKTSDVADSVLNFVNLERMADEFVSRHGYSSQIASGLKKMHDVFSVMDTGGAITVGGSITYGRFIKNCAALSSFLGISGSSYTKVFMELIGVKPADIYENEVNRTKRLLQNSKGAFKRDVLDPEDLAVYIVDYEKTLAILEQQKSLLRNSNIPMYTKRILKNLMFFTSILNSISMASDKAEVTVSISNSKKSVVDTLYDMDTRFLTEFRGLNNDLAELINNDFYYYAAKFKSLVK